MCLKKSVLVFVLLLMVSSAYADDVFTEYNTIKDKALVGDEFVFSVTVDNLRNETDSFRFYSPLTFFEWIFRMEPSSLFIKGEESKTVDIYLKPYDDEMEAGNYAITLNLVSNNYSNIETEMVFNVEILSYEDTIESELILPSRIDTGEDNLFRLRLSKDYDYDIKNLSVELKSDYFSERRDDINLEKDGLEFEFLVNFGNEIEEGDTDIHVLIYRDDKLILDRVETINIAASGDITEVGTPENGFLFYKETIERVNNQNAVSFESYTKKLSGFQKLFTSFSEEPTSVTKESGYYTYQWDFSLEPGEGKIISIESDYRSFVYGLIIVLIIVWLLYLYFKKDLSLTKRITSVQHSSENISTISVLLLLKNKSLCKIKNVKLMDGISNVVEKPTDFGSLTPIRIIKSEKGTKLLWDIPVIEGGAEIAISYTVKVKAKVIGNLPVPAGIVKYIKNKRRRIVKSNKVTMFS
ncbi:hypothetical protein K8R33_03060 [archaeon]|nr:hypothetical protein [archaeon]